MSSEHQRGFIHFFTLILLLIGIGTSVYLITKPATFKSKASESTPVLKSNYFKDDSTALGIINGQITDLTFSDLYTGIDHPSKMDPNKYQYKILSALRMLGYSYKNMFFNQVLRKWATHFQKTHYLPISDVIDKNFITNLDEAVYSQEQRVQPFIDLFPIDTNFTMTNFPNPGTIDYTYIAYHQNEPPKDHVRFFLSYIMSTFPPARATLTVDSIGTFIRGQGYMSLGYNNGWQYTYIPTAEPINKSGYGMYKSNRVNTQDFMDANTFFHEYGHYLDKRQYTDQYFSYPERVDTTSFYSILYDMNDCIMPTTGGYGLTCKPQADARFVSTYGGLSWENPNSPGHYYIGESFAEVIPMYILHGKLYRKLASLNSNYAQQYSWLKNNVFEGVEYQTGDESLILGRGWNYNDNVIPYNVSALAEELSFLHSNADQPIFSLTDLIPSTQRGTLPTPTPMPTPITSVSPTPTPVPTPTVVPTPIPTPTSTPNPIPPPPTITKKISCANKYSGEEIEISWVNPAGLPISWVDLSSSPTFENYYHKYVLGTTSTLAPTGFATASNKRSFLKARIDTVYYVRLFNGQHGSSASFSLSKCNP